MANPYLRAAAAKRRETIAIRKADTGCSCHNVDLLRCPDFHPPVFRTQPYLRNLAYARSLRVVTPQPSKVSSVRPPLAGLGVNRG